MVISRIVPFNPMAKSSEKPQSEPPRKVTFTTAEGEVFEVTELPGDLARATAIAGEDALRKIWDTPEEEEVWRNMLKGT